MKGTEKTGWISFGMSRERLAPLMSDRSVPLDFPPSDIAVCSWSIPRRFVVLDAWRGIAALWVAAYHFRIVGHITQTHFIRSGLVAVDFFFVLSGFVIWHGFGGKLVDRTSRMQFLIRRFGRLYPLHVVTLAVVIAMEVARYFVSLRYGFEGPPPFTGDHDWRLIPANLLLVHGLGLIPRFSWNVPSWSISVEFALCFCFVAFSLVRRPIPAAAALVFGAMVTLELILLLSPNLNETSTTMARGIAGFFLGVLIRESYRYIGGWTPNIWFELSAILAIFLSIYVGYPLLVLTFGYAVWIFGFETGAVSRLLKRPALVRQGDLSYSIYLTHYPLVLSTFAVVGMLGLLPRTGKMVITGVNPWLADVLLILFLLILLSISAATYSWIESPARAYFNKRASMLVQKGEH
jgi:peptidoglycan/LPS O-acetylase OafA/YrhL